MSEPGEQATDGDYDDFAAAYAKQNEAGLFNAWYEKPAMLALAGNVAGRRILDVGCGSGPTMAALLERGADVTGLDSSAAMIGLARERLGPDADLHVADLAEPLPFADDEFDDAIASLVLHYLEDWSGPLAELHRVLRPGGRLLVSVNHPVIFPVVYPDADYFAVTKYTEDYDFSGRTVWLTFYHRPLHVMTDSFMAAGFRITTVSEPAHDPATPKDLLPPDLPEGRAFLCFLFFDLEAV